MDKIKRVIEQEYYPDVTIDNVEIDIIEISVKTKDSFDLIQIERKNID